MIERYKWYAVRLPISKIEFYNRLLQNLYNESRESGFQAVNIESRGFRFIWKSTISASQLGADGEPVNQSIVTINYQDVSILDAETIIFRLKEPSRSVRVLLNALESIVGYGFSCDVLTLKQQHFSDILATVESYRLISAKISGSLPHSKLLARMEFISKEGFTLGDLQPLAKMKYVIESATYEVFYGGHRGHISFTPSGLCKTSGELSAMLLSELEIQLIKDVEK